MNKKMINEMTREEFDNFLDKGYYGKWTLADGTIINGIDDLYDHVRLNVDFGDDCGIWSDGAKDDRLYFIDSILLYKEISMS